MTDLFYDRLRGTVVGVPEERATTFGRWLLRPHQEATVFVNSVPVSDGDFLSPEQSGSWRVLEESGQRVEGSISKHQQLDELESESIRSLGRHLASMVADEKAWLEWTDVVPLVPGMSGDVELQPLDISIRDLFGHLEVVCMKPRAHLNVEVERVPVSKARRLPSRAASYLASHTEDWERPLLRSVLPKRVLSEVRHDEFDIYENRVAARLVDHLVAYLTARVRKVRKLLQVFQEKEDYSAAVGGTYHRRNRIHRLWGESIDANEGKRKAESTLKELERLRYRLMGLMDSPLYSALPRRGYVSPTLRNTNILANDQNYRRVAELWRAWVDAGHAKVMTPAERHLEAQELGHGMDRFALLLVVRALEQLGYEPGEQSWDIQVRAGGSWTLENHGAGLACNWLEDGRVELVLEGRRMTFISFPIDLGASTSDERVRALVDDTVNAANPDQRVIVLYAAATNDARTLSESLASQLHTVGNDPRTGLMDSVGFLPVSPWAIGSVERVSRAIRWFIDGTRYDAYPMEIPLAAEAAKMLASLSSFDWLETRASTRKILLRRPPADSEWAELDLDGHVKTARTNYEAAERDHKRISAELRDAVRDGKTGKLRQQKSAANKKVTQLKQRLQAFERLCDELAEARLHANALLRCPACGEHVDPRVDFEVRENDCFRCDCPECGSRWGTRMCSDGHRYAMMIPGKFVEADDTTSAGWEDRTYGSDLLAIPARTADGGWGFVCPKCGEVT